MAETNAKSPDGLAVDNIAGDRLLVERFNRGESSAFDKIVENYSPDVAALANRLLGWPGDTEDVVQDIFLSAMLGLKKFRCQCSLKTWLFTITINKCRTYRYKRFLRIKFFAKTRPRISADYAPPSDKPLLEKEKYLRIRLIISALPAKYRETVILRYLHEFPISRISEILGVSNNVVQVRLSRAKERLKKDLAEFIQD